MPEHAATQATPPTPTFTISELAREFDLTTRAIRFYEDCGLLDPQRRGRHRVYSARDRTRLKLTLRGKRLGLTLAEVKELVDMYESPRDTHPQLTKFLAVLAAHRHQLEQQLADLHATLDEVRAHEKEARRLLGAGPKGTAARARASVTAGADDGATSRPKGRTVVVAHSAPATPAVRADQRRPIDKRRTTA